MSEAGSAAVPSAGGQIKAPTSDRSSWLAVVGLVLVPLAAVLVVLEVFLAIAGLHRYLGLAGTTDKRAVVYWIWFLVIGACGPVTVTLVWCGPLRTGMTTRNRLATIGFVGTAIGLLATLLLLPY
jgi:hypothetical protein